MEFPGLVSVALLVVMISGLWKVLLHLLWRPYVMAKAFRKQGFRGPAYNFCFGSAKELIQIHKAGQDVILDNTSHDITVRVLRHLRQWTEQYGTMFVYWIGPTPHICITDPEVTKELISNNSGFYIKPYQNQYMLALAGKGLVFLEGSDWVRHRRIVNPAFTMDKLKMLTKEMAACAKLMLEEWQAQVSQGENHQKEIDVDKQFEELTADIISRTAFGSSYAEGKEVFLTQKKLHVLAAESFFRLEIPGFSYLPTKRNIRRWKLEKKLRNKLRSIIKARLVSKDYTYGNYLLGLMLKTNEEQDGQTMSMDEIVDECKTFFFGGHETTSHFLTWCVFLLSSYPDWQEKLREEVLRECATEIPNADILNKLKLVNMFLLETLRLYSPVTMIGRKATKDMTLGKNIKVPNGTELYIPIPIIHRSKEIWGDDANDFNPIRFENGISKAAKHPNALLAFSVGPRGCIGQNFAMLEAKTVIAMILQRFSFCLSDNYKHMPSSLITLQPEYGLPIIFRPLHI